VAERLNLRRSPARTCDASDHRGVFLQAVINPPRSVLDAVAEAVADAVPASAPGIVPSAAGHLNLPIAALGSVTMGDAIRVTAALKDAASLWPAPTVCFAGATVHEFPKSRAIVLSMEGAVDELLWIARETTHCLQRRGFHFDRRKFVPLLSVATIRDSATGAEVMACLDALAGFRGEAWTVDHVSLVKRTWDTTSPETSEFQPILLGAH
jgi:2'-5' RNA ligase